MSSELKPSPLLKNQECLTRCFHFASENGFRQDVSWNGRYLCSVLPAFPVALISKNDSWPARLEPVLGGPSFIPPTGHWARKQQKPARGGLSVEGG
jgi:hypothetical protein